LRCHDGNDVTPRASDNQIEGRDAAFPSVTVCARRGLQKRYRKARDQYAVVIANKIEADTRTADRSPRQDSVRHGIAEEDHQPQQHQEDADRAAPKRQRGSRGQCAAHEPNSVKGAIRRVR